MPIITTEVPALFRLSAHYISAQFLEKLFELFEPSVPRFDLGKNFDAEFLILQNGYLKTDVQISEYHETIVRAVMLPENQQRDLFEEIWKVVFGEHGEHQEILETFLSSLFETDIVELRYPKKLLCHSPHPEESPEIFKFLQVDFGSAARGDRLFDHPPVPPLPQACYFEGHHIPIALAQKIHRILAKASSSEVRPLICLEIQTHLSIKFLLKDHQLVSKILQDTSEVEPSLQLVNTHLEVNLLETYQLILHEFFQEEEFFGTQINSCSEIILQEGRLFLEPLTLGDLAVYEKIAPLFEDFKAYSELPNNSL